MANKIPKIEYTSAPITITFELPPSGDFRNDTYKANSKSSKSSNGTEQVQFNYTDHVQGLNFPFVSEAIKLELDTFFLDHALEGKEFKYFEDKDLSSFITVSLNRREYKPLIMFPSSTPDEYVYEIKIVIREAI